MKPDPLPCIPRPPGELPPGRHDEYYREVKVLIDAGWPMDRARIEAVARIVARDGKATTERGQGRLF